MGGLADCPSIGNLESAMGEVAASRDNCMHYVRRLAINPHTSRMSTAPTMLAMKPAP